MSVIEKNARKWYVMRDLKRANSKLPAYKFLREIGIDFFTPMKSRLVTRNSKRIREEVPCMSSLLFVHDCRTTIDRILEKMPTLQYRFEKGKEYMTPMVVRDSDMERFIHAVRSAENPEYYLPDELAPSMYGKQVRIIGGQLDGYEGRLLSVRGSRTKRILIELPSWLTAAIEVNPEYIQIL